MVFSQTRSSTIHFWWQLSTWYRHVMGACEINCYIQYMYSVQAVIFFRQNVCHFCLISVTKRIQKLLFICSLWIKHFHIIMLTMMWRHLDLTGNAPWTTVCWRSASSRARCQSCTSALYLCRPCQPSTRWFPPVSSSSYASSLVSALSRETAWALRWAHRCHLRPNCLVWYR